MDVSRIASLPLGEAAGTAGGTGAAAGGNGAPSFGQVLKDSLAQVSSLQHDADSAIQSLATGGTATLHDTMLAVEKAELSFRLMLQVRNKIVEAYQEVLRMQV